ncbi:MAG TPA: metalloregulator ArsR/SmtB family transcription factor [Tepidisphaeraceae bacterium]|jgi:ArsR family transcriptional regulator|nr:metalloregulator ArsR/SmtB family transcription factor [Tepidisphaeraceae bacterium]
MIKPSAQPDQFLLQLECLADDTRLRLLRLLERHELGVAEICDVLQMPQSTVSRHLKVLTDGQWTRSRRQGTTHLYRTIVDELEPAARKLWLLAREQTEDWATIKQDELRLARRLSQRQGDAQAFFAGAASQWDKLRGELYGESFTTAAMLAMLSPELTVADLGCGTAPLVAMLAPHVKQVIGVDNSPAMLKAAKKRTADLPNVDLRRGDLTSLPVDDASIDAALLILALTYVPDATGAVTEAARILRPGGRLIIVDLLPHDRDDFRRQLGQVSLGIDAKDLEAMMAAGQLRHLKITPLPPEESAKGPALFLATGRRD